MPSNSHKSSTASTKWFPTPACVRWRGARRRRRGAPGLGAPQASGGAATLSSWPACRLAAGLLGAYRRPEGRRYQLDWPDASAVLAKAEEEIEELRQALAAGDEASVREEMGDVLFTLANLARKLNADPEAALAGTNRKFRRRFSQVEEGSPPTAGRRPSQRWRRWTSCGKRRRGARAGFASCRGGSGARGRNPP